MILHIDTANQINNSWYGDTAVCVRSEDGAFSCSIMINASLKCAIRKSLCIYPEKKIVNHLQAYLVFLLFKKKEDSLFRMCVETSLLCPDVRPKRLYMNSLGRCFNFYGKQEFFQSLKFRFKSHKSKSRAHVLAQKVYRKKIRPVVYFTRKDMVVFTKYFIKQSVSRK